jgi:acyl carrier protein
MGLDGVEIVMATEEAFDIAIKNSEAEKIFTPRGLIDLVLSKVDQTAFTACLTQRAFYRLRSSLMRQLNVRRNHLRPGTPLARTFHLPTRKEKMRRILADLGAKKELDFVRPDWAVGFIVIVAIFGGAATAVIFVLASRLEFGLMIPLWAIFGGLLAWIGCFATRFMRTEFQPSLATVGDLSRWIVVNAPHAVQAEPGKWNRQHVSETVRQIVIHHLGCEKEYREDARFVEDLGMD